MFPLEAFEHTLTRLVKILDGCGIAFHLTGGVTSIAYGEPRMTQDIDLVIDNAATKESIERLFEQLAAADFLFDETAIRNAVRDHRMFQLLDTIESLKVDLYPRELIEGELKRSELKHVFPELRLPVASLADAVVSKLIWISKGSHKNRRDVRQIVSRATVEQRELIRRLSIEMQVRQLLTEVLGESDEIE